MWRFLADTVRFGTKESTVRFIVMFSVVVPISVILFFWGIACLWDTPNRVVMVPIPESLILLVSSVVVPCVIGKVWQNYTENAAAKDAGANPTVK